MQLPIEWLPEAAAPEQLIVLLHGAGSDAVGMAPLGQALRIEFPHAAVLAPDAPHVCSADTPAAHAFAVSDAAQPTGSAAPQAGTGLSWFAAAPTDGAQSVVAAAAADFERWLRQTQQRLRVPPAATAIAGFSQGAALALQAAFAHDGLAGRVLAFSGWWARLPDAAPRETTLHLFHGGADARVPAAVARSVFARLSALHADATLDIAEEVGHEIHPALVGRAIFRLQNHIPARTWAAALGSAPRGGLSPRRRQGGDGSSSGNGRRDGDGDGDGSGGDGSGADGG